MGAGRRAVAAGAAALSLLTAGASAQKPTGTATGTTVSGTVVERASRRPIGGVVVSLQPVPTGSKAILSNFLEPQPAIGSFLGFVISGADGRFTFSNVPPGAYAIEATASGWITGDWEPASSDPKGDWITIAGASRPVEVTVPMEPAPAVRGRIVDETGEPAVGVVVNAFVAHLHAWPQWGYAGLTQTDDRGMFRFALSGEGVVIRAQPSTTANARSLIYPPLFFPSVPSLAQAHVFRLRAGDVQIADFRIEPLRAFRVRGHVIGAQTISNVRLTLTPADSAWMMGLNASEAIAAPGPDGGFEFRAVPAGRYVLRAIEPPRMPTGSHGPWPLKELPAEPTLAAEIDVNLTDSDLALAVQLEAGVRISGRVEFDGEPTTEVLAQLKQIPIVIERADGVPIDLRGLFLDAKTFTTIQIPRGRYLMRTLHAQGWFLRSILHEGRDIADEPFDVGGEDLKDVVITFTNRRSFLSGTVTGAAEKRRRPWVIAFPSERRLWPRHTTLHRRVAITQLGTAGTYQIQLHAGGYLVCVIDEPPTLLTSEVFESLARQAVHVWINEGGRHTQTLSWAGGLVRR